MPNGYRDVTVDYITSGLEVNLLQLYAGGKADKKTNIYIYMYTIWNRKERKVMEVLLPHIHV